MKVGSGAALVLIRRHVAERNQVSKICSDSPEISQQDIIDIWKKTVGDGDWVYLQERINPTGTVEWYHNLFAQMKTHMWFLS